VDEQCPGFLVMNIIFFIGRNIVLGLVFMETATNSQEIELMFQKILGKLQTIEDRLYELDYPAESTIKETVIEEVMVAEKEISGGDFIECTTAKAFMENLKK
jgi:hypothetical protein